MATSTDRTIPADLADRLLEWAASQDTLADRDDAGDIPASEEWEWLELEAFTLVEEVVQHLIDTDPKA